MLCFLHDILCIAVYLFCRNTVDGLTSEVKQLETRVTKLDKQTDKIDKCVKEQFVEFIKVRIEDIL